MMLALLLAIVLAVVEGDPLLHPPTLQLLHLYREDVLNGDLFNDVHPPHSSPEFFHSDELTALGTQRVEPLFTTLTSDDIGEPWVRRPTAGSSSTAAVVLQDSLVSDSTVDSADERQNGEEKMLDIDVGSTETLTATDRTAASGTERRLTTTASSGKDHLFISRRKNPKDQPHRRQKRFILGNKLRTIAVPLSVFNFLGFLPVRVPGLPYHNDLPSPDYSHYDTTYEVYVPRRRRRRRFRFYD